MLIGGGLIQFAAVVDQWWITFPSFVHAPLARGGGRTWRRKQQRRVESGVERGFRKRHNARLCPPREPSLPILNHNNNNVFSDKPFCVRDGSGLRHWAAITRSHIVSGVAGGSWEKKQRSGVWEEQKQDPGKSTVELVPAASETRRMLCGRLSANEEKSYCKEKTLDLLYRGILKCW